MAGSPACTGFKPGPLPGCLPSSVVQIIAGGGNSLLLGDNIVVKVVLPR
ncbi:hypothetical protein [Pseudoduganella chitinolytica]|uniref:Uncharacterized protein n=1 Tax=Pseudoduganella chitinolytica TaxID=34070 RepID=A0ABY8B903_9BURK|nr:hypothetical protein [Pseudoduganella chitinolytica]WEF31237.1 hypothetical protein PX653_17425 [Pseudoduganella chitinolytica]